MVRAPLPGLRRDRPGSLTSRHRPPGTPRPRGPALRQPPVLGRIHIHRPLMLWTSWARPASLYQRTAHRPLGSWPQIETLARENAQIAILVWTFLLVTGGGQGQDRTVDLPLFRITDHRAGLAMMVSLPAQRPVVYADRRSCTWVYETTNETKRRHRHRWLAIMSHSRSDASHRPNRLAAGGSSIGLPTEGGVRCRGWSGSCWWCSASWQWSWASSTWSSPFPHCPRSSPATRPRSRATITSADTSRSLWASSRSEERRVGREG